jgi:hypothetical protein
MKRLLLLSLLIFAVYSIVSAQNQTPAPITSPDSLAVPVFSAIAPSFDSLNLHSGDSVFIFGGELYFHARSNGKDFFISRDELLAHADSLIIYQYYRLGAGTEVTQKSDSTAIKIERKRCTMITQEGTRCKRLAQPGTDRCWQHKK